MHPKLLFFSSFTHLVWIAIGIVIWVVKYMLLQYSLKLFPFNELRPKNSSKSNFTESQKTEEFINTYKTSTIEQCTGVQPPLTVNDTTNKNYVSCVNERFGLLPATDPKVPRDFNFYF